MIKEIKIYDLDGTIIDSSHRYRVDKCGTKIDLQFWRDNDIPEKILQDSLLPLAKQYKKDLANPEIYVIIATARAANYGDANWKFVLYNLGLPNKFIHRNGVNDTRKGARLKISAIKPLLNLCQFKNAVVHVFEDNLAYLEEMCKELNAIPHYVPSVQGH